MKSGDLFRAVKKGEASIVTDHIDTFTAKGIRLKSGEELEADIIITATGLDLKFFGGIAISVDGNPFDITTKMNYKGVMLEDLPNIGFTTGYTNASWTLKADLTSEFLCRLINKMDKKGTPKALPVNRDAEMKKDRFMNFSAGYVERAKDSMPLMGERMPWRLYQSYPMDLMLLRYGKMEDKKLRLVTQ